jgi:hypothetical protein
MSKSLITAIKNSNVVIEFFCYLALLFRIFPRGTNTKYYMESIALWDSSIEVREKLGGVDAGQLLDASLTFSTLHDLDPASQFWIARVWSLGLSIFQVPAIWLEKIHLPFSMTMIMLNFLIWAALIRIVFQSINGHKQSLLFLVLLISFLFSYDGSFLFQEFPFNSEVIGIGMMLISLTLVIRFLKIEKKPFKFFLIPGIILGISICVRYTIDLAVIFIFLISVLFYSLLKYDLLKSLLRRKESKSYLEVKRSLILIFKYLIVTFGVALLVTLPLRIVNQVNYGGAPLQMSSANALSGPSLWAKSESPHAKYWDKTGMNWACDIAPLECNSPEIEGKDSSELFRMAIFVAILNPVDFLKNRIYYFWMNHSMVLSDNIYMFIYSLFQISLIFLPLLLFHKVKPLERILLSIVWMPFILLQYLTYLIIHFETRYFAPLHLLNLCLLFHMCLLIQGKKTNRSKNLS